MRIILQALELLLYLIALAGIAFGVAVIVMARHNSPDNSEFRATTTLVAVYLAMPPFTIGVVGLVGGAMLTAIDQLRQGR